MKLTKADLQRTAVAVVLNEGGRIYRFNGTLIDALQTDAGAVFLKTGHIWDIFHKPMLTWDPKWVRESLEFDLPDVGSMVWYLEAWPSLKGVSIVGNKYTWDPARTGPGPSSPFPPGVLSRD